MIITNFQNLAKNDLRKKALEIAEAGYEAIDIEKKVRNRIKIENDFLKVIKTPTILKDSVHNEIEINLNNYKRIFLVGIGKGSALASATLAEILGDKLTSGIALDIPQYKEVQLPKINRQYLGSPTSQKLKFLVGTHPIPSKQNIEATKKIIELEKSFKKDDLLITFICGGGSALLCGSEKELRYSQTVFKELTKAGATIEELNTVRKHLSEIKGGGLAKIAYPAQIISFIVSDVCGNDLSTVASGPTVFNKTTNKDAKNIFKKYGFKHKNFHFHENPKEKKYFKKVKNILFACNQDAIMAMLKKAEEVGFSAKIHSLALQGEAKKIFSSMIEKIKPNEAVLAAGETTITFKKLPAGKGGRNTEAVLGALVKCQVSGVKCQNVVIMSFASDGHDNTEAAGAIGDGLTLEKAKELNLNIEKFLDDNHNTFHFFEKTNDLIFVEQKCFNVADLMVVLKSSK